MVSTIVRRMTTDDEEGVDVPPLLVESVFRRFGTVHALSDVSLEVAAGEIHAILGPNGAGKTTLLRILSGLVRADEGKVELFGFPAEALPDRTTKRLIGLVPSGDRSFYLRLSGLENLAFFAGLHGLTRRQAVARASECLRAVDLSDAAQVWVGKYSHGMQKRLSVARALLMDPPILFVDEATHDLDPDGARRIRALIADAAARGAAIIWATQRVEEIRGFTHRMTLLHRGRVRFSGTVPEFLATSDVRSYLVQLKNRSADPTRLMEKAQAALTRVGTITSADGSGANQYRMFLKERAILGQAVTSLTAAGIQVLACREERSGVEEAFLRLTRDENI